MRRLIVATLLLLALLSPLFGAQSFSESDWHMAFNSKVTRGEVEAWLPTGRIDIPTDRYAIEVDHVRNYREGIKQALQYAAATKRSPGLALFIDGAQDTVQALDAARKLCIASDVRFWLINEYVSVDDLVSQKGLRTTASPQSALLPSTSRQPGESVQAIEKTHWLNTDTGVRHNRSCRWFGNTKNGRYCRPDEGRACKVCGG